MKRAQVSAPRWLVRTAVRLMPVPKSDAVRVTKARTGRVRLRVYIPGGERSGVGLLWVHGGGLLFGDAKQDESLCLSTAERLGIVIVSANYRFAPEHPFPAAHEDVLAAWDWFLEHAEELGVDPDRIVVGGESAGAGLAAALAHRIHDDEANREGWAGYLGTAPGEETVPPHAVPARRTDLGGLPPTFITWGDIELFADEDRAYAEALRLAGVPVTTDVVKGAPHGFENWAKDTPTARALLGRAQEWLRSTTRRR
ncbi:alpha/beta hydrolase [Microbacterium sp. dk485]|uniref:Alpha/beta hydrolase n=2 Tax=Microbacteriaceae TaxID=85023 RepID=A0ABX5SXA0_9MICO|nr:alpha/beta hydrolase [Microbacterium sp. EYE_512]QBR90779.1 alpha/beta hydrolase [Microbacterium wangchenii]TFV85581.1 alpha/beta hydrolase [Microbacterium sp. dk485]TXK09313.1 alpha/beta hydrolase [Microbacterium wangchenii]